MTTADETGSAWFNIVARTDMIKVHDDHGLSLIYNVTGQGCFSNFKQMKNGEILPEKTIERLSQYRRTLLRLVENEKGYIFSHELANILNITAVQVRRDIMLMGYSGQLRKGYDIKRLIEAIGNTIDSKKKKNVVVVGAGKLGRAIIGYFSNQNTQLNIIACYDVDPLIVDTKISGIHCYHIDDLQNAASENNAELAILTVPQRDATSMADHLVKSGIKGILNYTSTSLKVPENVFLEEYDMVTSLEKVAYFSDRL